ncbi:MAG: hypothetical protein WCG28_02725 [bacterium]
MSTRRFIAARKEVQEKWKLRSSNSPLSMGLGLPKIDPLVLRTTKPSYHNTRHHQPVSTVGGYH